MPKKKTTINDLAILIKKGFDQTATKEELRPLATKEELRQLVTKREFRKETGGIKEEIRELKEQILRLSGDVSQLKEEVHRDNPFVEDLLRRMRVVEKKVGITK